MRNIKRPAPFVLIAANHGTMIVCRNDYHMIDAQHGYGVGHQIMHTGCFDAQEIDFALELLLLRRQYFGDGVIGIDCGANIGVHTIEWARLMHTWGHVWAFEAQEKIFYCLAGNIIINNCLNVTARFAAVGKENGELNIAEPDYLQPASFGSFELQQKPTTEFIGQTIDYASTPQKTPQIALDTLPLSRLDFLKIDVEGMEEDVMMGAENIIQQYKPVMIIEAIKSDKNRLHQILEEDGFVVFNMGINLLTVHKTDPSLQHLKQEGNQLYLQRNI